ncbi:FxsC protein [Solwaraspora sp. WMMD1047]|uniref:FxsC protein n=1 Tax=Solwaraspora sp. WMMD1047 TaxID=3016102 RepID=UPI002416FA91|nr:FxsC protein [Solwaraspora sp. WMMD1047]MDG4833528.1 FxsC protein [Solwaraspora sp. WMMD1047]
MLRFFLSRAAGDDDSYALRFFRDLSATIREIADVAGDVGFVEASDAGGRAPWSIAARDALTSCRTFVALCSPRYFLSERNGRQWWIFADRIRRYERATGQRPPALIPVLWSSAGEAEHPGGGDRRGELGNEPIRQLIRLRSRRPQYETYLAELAGRIMTCAETHPLPESEPDFDPDRIPNAFDLGGADATTETPEALAFAEAPTQRVHFVVAAGSRSEMDEVRNDLRFYGERGRDWAAYHPTLAEPLVAHARALAGERLFGSDVSDLDQLAHRVDQARRNNEIVVLLVDSWVTRLAGYQRMLAEFDGRGESGVAVLAPASSTDPETVRHRGELRAQLGRTFPHNLNRGDQLVRIEIDSPESFEIDLVTALEEAQNRIFSHGRVFRRPAGDEPPDRPILQGP